LVCEGAPKIIHEIGFARDPDVVENRFYARVSRSVFVCPEFYRRQYVLLWLEHFHFYSAQAGSAKCVFS
jgi:hypothetical protein